MEIKQNDKILNERLTVWNYLKKDYVQKYKLKNTPITNTILNKETLKIEQEKLLKKIRFRLFPEIIFPKINKTKIAKEYWNKKILKNVLKQYKVIPYKFRSVVERYQRIEFILRNTTLQEYETIYIYPKYEEKKLKIDFTLESLRIRFKNNKVYQLH